MKKIILLLSILFSVLGKQYAQCIPLYHFSGNPDGGYEIGQLITDSTFLYGMTYGGGPDGIGTIFRIMPDGTGYTNLFNFSDTTGAGPHGALVSDGNFMYGMTYMGGTNYGTIFKIMPDGTGFSTLLNFSGINGAYPFGDLFFDGTYLYGMTTSGGTFYNGNIFRINPDGTGFVNLHSFPDTVNGRRPYGHLVSDGTFLYGMTNQGGIEDIGTIFKIMPDGTGFVKLHDFTGGLGIGWPYGSLLYDGGYLYGMTFLGGIGAGAVFKILPDGTGFTNILEFNGSNGAFPNGSLISDGTYLYGMTRYGGANSTGVLFKVLPDGNGDTVLCEFSGPNGSSPYGDVFLYENSLFGMTWGGGAYNYGVLFKYQNCGSPAVSLTPFSPDTICISTSPFLLTGGSPSGGIYLGNGVVSGMFDPSVAGDSMHTITYVYTDSMGCSGFAEQNIYVDPCSGGIDPEMQTTVLVYPNPNFGIVNMESSSEIQTIEIFNNLGEKVNSFDLIFENHIKVEVDLPNGVYFLNIITKSGIIKKKMIFHK